MPGCSGEPVVTTSCAFSFLHARLRVQRAPGIPCALSIRAVDAKLGRTAPRECGGVVEPDSVIASAAKRSSFVLHLTMDCFATLAMTAKEGCESCVFRHREERKRRSDPASCFEARWIASLRSQ